MRHDDGVRILVAPDRFAGLTSVQAADVMAAGWATGAPHDVLTRLPLSDGGPGFLEVVRAACDGELVPVTVEGPAQVATPVPVLLVEDTAGVTAYVEAALVLGPHLLAPADAPDPGATGSAALGRLLRVVRDRGARRVVVAVGGAATHDAGAGLLAGLGLPSGALERGGSSLADLSRGDLEGLAELRREWAEVDLVAAVDSDVQLLGLHGASAGLSSARTVTAERAQALEGALSAFAHLVGDVVAQDTVRRDLLLPRGDGREHTRRLTQLPGAGAGGGLGFALAVLGGRLRAGAQVTAEVVGLARRVADADLVLTGEQELDGHSLHDGVVAVVAAEALRTAVPVVAVAGQVHAGRREWGAAGLAGVYAVHERPGSAPRGHDGDLAAALGDRVARVARTWSR